MEALRPKPVLVRFKPMYGHRPKIEIEIYLLIKTAVRLEDKLPIVWLACPENGV